MEHTKSNRGLPELLAPAGSPEALQAAISAGADAVYFGGAAFSNRMRARNFTTTDELTEALQQTGRWGVQSYITINTRVRDDEMGDALALAEFLLRGGCSGFIVADMGIAAQIHSRFPEAMLHGSTQMTLANAQDAQMMAQYGFTRMVVPREISLAELKSLVQESPLEIEMFLHGAYCVSVSGQCLMSWAMGGRSGNRGECAQPCRMVYRMQRGLDGIGEKQTDRRLLPKPDSRSAAEYPLSLKDMCLAARIPEIIASGVTSLKIEGRQKPAPYVYGVTKIYRKLLDERRAATVEEIRALDELFSRDGFTDGYFRSAEDVRAYSHMGGIRPTTEEQMQQQDARKPAETVTKYDFAGRAAPCTGKLTLQAGEPAVMTMTHRASGICVTVTGDMPQPATGNPVNGESLAKNLAKLGTTPFCWADGQPETNIGEGLWYPVSAVNAIRRSAAEALEAALHPQTVIREGTPYAHTETRNAAPGSLSPAIAVLTGREQWSDALTDAFETVYIPAQDYLKWANDGGVPANVGADLPVLVFDGERLAALVRDLERAGCTHVRFHSPGQLRLLNRTDMHACGSFRLNVWNSDALHWWYAAGADRVTVSPEVTLGGLRSLAKAGIPGGAIVYGHIPLMLTERCVLHALPRGAKKNVIPCGGLGGRMPDAAKTCGGTSADPCRCTGVLTDRTGTRFPMYAGNGETTICNSLPLWMADKMDTLPPLTHREFLFTVESADGIRQVIRDTEAGRQRAGKRLK
ncbi:MAG: U32 family peptidase [Clostridia bacterium]|nr:U32 family peptidase [Clostridia bacterium]